MELPKKYKKFITEQGFPGFPDKPSNNYWRYPRIVDGWWHTLIGSEQKVLDYILRHTWGYDKDQDAISISQFREGIYSKKGRNWIDRGVGLKNDAIINAIKGLIEKRFIIAEKKSGKTTVYSLRSVR